MALLVPDYIINANIQDQRVQYEWDDWRSLESKKIDDKTITRLREISRKAILAFMCGSAEWLIYRFAKLCDVQMPEAYIEAAWAMLINVRYVGYGSFTWQEYENNEWIGPIKQPITKALQWLETAIQDLEWEGTDPAFDAFILSNIVTYVLADSKPYQIWSNQVLECLKVKYPRNPKDKQGDVVPRQVLNLGCSFNVNDTELLINNFLKKLDYHSNEFLSTPSGMKELYDDEEEGFIGTPYLFDLELDRRSRL